MNLINAAILHRADCFIFTSSIAVYGTGQLPLRENTPPRPEDPYGIAKFAVEQDLQAAHRIFGLPYVIFRPHNVYGEYQNIGDPYRNVVGIFMNQILQGKPMTIFGDGEQQRAFTYIADMAPIIARAPLMDQSRNRVFNVGADYPCTVNALAFFVARAMEVDLRAVHLPAREEVQLAYADHSALREAFGCIPETPLEEGLRRMASWVKMVGVRSGKEFENIEISRNLPLAWKRPSEAQFPLESNSDLLRRVRTG
jgi:UDP-glucose 4-epimerase